MIDITMNTPTDPSLPFTDRTVGELVAEDYRRGATFKQFGIDFCCGGGRTVAAACKKADVDPAALERALADADQRTVGVPARVNAWSTAFLADYIVNEHHTYVRESLPVLRAFAQKVAKVHGHARPELLGIAERVEALADELTGHLASEENEVFPRIKALASADAPDVEALRALVDEMEHEHDGAGTLMREIRALSDDFTPPEWACNTYRALFAKLEEFEGDLHRHVHLENNVLFPKALAADGAPA
jgi:regulator of cell morphogenesis and NO signaling